MAVFTPGYIYMEFVRSLHVHRIYMIVAGWHNLFLLALAILACVGYFWPKLGSGASYISERSPSQRSLDPDQTKRVGGREVTQYPEYSRG